jgi:hypothetical protein
MWFKSGMEATKRSGLKPIAKIVIPKRFAKAFWKYFFDAQIAEFQSVLTSEIDNATYYILNKNI